MGCCQSTSGDIENQNLDMISIVNAESYDLAPPLPGAFQQSFDSSFSENLKEQGQTLFLLKSLKESTPNLTNLKSEILDNPLESISQQQNLPVNSKIIAKPVNLFGALIQSAVNEVKDKGGELEIDKNFMKNVTGAEKLIGDQANFVGGVIKDGFEQSAVLAQSQVALLKEGLDEAIHAIQDLKLKKRLHNIVYPVLRKVFVHSVACEIETKYNILNILGKGNFSTVKKVSEKSTGIERAAKIIVKSTLSDKQTENLITEVEILKQLDHQNIVRVVEIVEEVSKICIITELCGGGELFERIIKAESFDELMASKIMYQILSGLIHIHKNGFIHRDLKPENLMFMDQELDSLKIIDFGITKEVSELSQRKNSCVGSVYFI